MEKKIRKRYVSSDRYVSLASQIVIHLLGMVVSRRNAKPNMEKKESKPTKIIITQKMNLCN